MGVSFSDQCPQCPPFRSGNFRLSFGIVGGTGNGVGSFGRCVDLAELDLSTIRWSWGLDGALRCRVLSLLLLESGS